MDACRKIEIFSVFENAMLSIPIGHLGVNPCLTTSGSSGVF